MTTGQTLRKLRQQKNISQLELELSVNLSTGTISRIENGRINPTKETLFKIAELLALDKFETLQLLGLEFNELEKYIPNKILKQTFFDGNQLGNHFLSQIYNLAYYNGKDQFVNECDSSLNTDETEVLYIQSFINWRKIYEEEYAKTYHVPARIQKKKYARFILNNVQNSYDFRREDSKYYRETRILNGLDFDYNLMILQNRLTIFLTDPYPITLTINDGAIANKFRSIFNITWRSIDYKSAT